MTGSNSLGNRSPSPVYPSQGQGSSAAKAPGHPTPPNPSREPLPAGSAKPKTALPGGPAPSTLREAAQVPLRPPQSEAPKPPNHIPAKDAPSQLTPARDVAPLGDEADDPELDRLKGTFAVRNKEPGKKTTALTLSRKHWRELLKLKNECETNADLLESPVPFIHRLIREAGFGILQMGQVINEGKSGSKLWRKPVPEIQGGKNLSKFGIKKEQLTTKLKEFFLFLEPPVEASQKRDREESIGGDSSATQENPAKKMKVGPLLMGKIFGEERQLSESNWVELARLKKDFNDKLTRTGGERPKASLRWEYLQKLGKISGLSRNTISNAVGFREGNFDQQLIRLNNIELPKEVEATAGQGSTDSPRPE